MRSELENSEQIDRYLNQQMASEELVYFEQKLNDPAFRREVEEHRLLHELVVDRGLIDLRKKLQALDNSKTSGHTNRFTRWAIGILLVVVVGVLTTYRFARNEVEVAESSAEQNGATAQKTVVIPPGAATIAESDNKTRKSTTGVSVQRDTTNNAALTEIVQPEPDKGTVEHQELKSVTIVATPDTLSIKKFHTAPEPAPEKKNEEKVPECAIALSELKILTVASCVNSPTGRVVIDGQSKLKGTAPFQFSINSEKYFETRTFTHLYAGNYILTVRDAAGCEWQYPAEIRVDENDCSTTEYAFYPEKREVWKLSVSSATNGKIEIYNRNGSLVYAAEIVDGYPDQWDGTASNGQVLPMGSYSFILRTGGKSVTGQVTILK